MRSVSCVNIFWVKKKQITKTTIFQCINMNMNYALIAQADIVLLQAYLHIHSLKTLNIQAFAQPTT